MELIRERFRNLTEPAPDIVRAEQHYKGLPLSVYYFDFTQVVARPDFDLRAYTQDRIASDFYQHEGSLQWNYYLYFVLESAALQKLQAEKLVAPIEGDRSFARKFIRDEKSLNQELSEPLAQTLHTTELAQDIASRWVKALSDAGLGQIADPNADYKPAIRDYLAGKSTRPPSAAVGVTTPAANGRFIQMLDLGSFRMHPAVRRFEFGRVNLFRGVNGTGKTSVLEAIELCICGGIRRQNGDTNGEPKLQIQFQGQIRPQTCPEVSLATYRARDRAWFGGYYLQGNRLFDNFGRFNFFDTDAATQLSAASTADGILSAINTLFLGEYANTIEERMKQCRERFARDQRELLKLLKVRRAEVQKATEDLKQVRAVKDTREALIEELKAKADACNWKKIGAKPTLSDIALLQEAASAAAESLADAAKRVNWIGRPSLISLQREADQLTAALKEIARLRDASETNSNHLGIDQARLHELESDVTVLTRLLEYHAQPDAFALAESAEVVASIKQTLSRLKEAAGKMRGLNLKAFENSTESIETLSSQHAAEATKRRRNLTRLQSRATEMQAQLGQIKSVVEEIKGLGIRFCEVSPNAKLCPLCGSEHSDLRARIESLAAGQALEAPLGEFTTQIAREQAELSTLQAGADALTRLDEAAQLFFAGSKNPPRSVKAAIEHLARIPELQAAQKAALDARKATDQRLNLAGFNAEELLTLLDTAEEENGLPRTKVTKADSARGLHAEKVRAAGLLRATVKERTQLQKTNEQELRKIRTRHLGDRSVGDPDVELERRQSTVDELLAALRSPRFPITLADKDEFPTAAAQLSSFAGAITRIHDSYKRVEEKDALEQRLATSLSDAQTEVQKLEPSDARATAALKLLDELLGSDYKEAYLRDVRTAHKDKLTTIFLRIHAPHEFKDVRLENGVRLERQTGTLSSVAAISTGQRAALALSIFLGLNSSVAARAPWLLFDDPIAHVDDLNVVSFLDMLRDLVFLGDRQIFFATANSRLADLFARKFDCLASDFKEFRLER